MRKGKQKEQRPNRLLTKQQESIPCRSQFGFPAREVLTQRNVRGRIQRSPKPSVQRMLFVTGWVFVTLSGTNKTFRKTSWKQKRSGGMNPPDNLVWLHMEVEPRQP